MSDERQWWNNLHELQECLSSNGDNIALLPKHLKRWLQNQQTSYELLLSTGRQPPPLTATIALSEEKYRALTSLELLFSSPSSLDFEQEWHDMLKQLKKYKAKHNDCRVPRHHPRHRRLGVWVYNQRQQYRLLHHSGTANNNTKSNLTKKRIDALDALGFEWFLNAAPCWFDDDDDPRHPIHDPSWKALYRQLCEYKKLHGNCLVPQAYDDNPQLGNWVFLQRQQYRSPSEGDTPSATTPLSRHRIKLLDELSFEWDVDNINISRMAFETKFEKRLLELREFRNRHGHCDVPADYEENHELGLWVRRQQDFYKLLRCGKGSLLTEERVEKLRRVGFDFSFFDDAVCDVAIMDGQSDFGDGVHSNYNGNGTLN